MGIKIRYQTICNQLEIAIQIFQVNKNGDEHSPQVILVHPLDFKAFFSQMRKLEKKLKLEAIFKVYDKTWEKTKPLLVKMVFDKKSIAD